MTTHKLKDLITYTKLAQCSSCDSHEYKLPLPITKGIEPFLSAFGSLKYPLDRVKLIKLDNDYVYLNSRVGSSSIRVKFKKDPSQRSTFEIQLAAYLSQEMQITVVV